MSVSHEENHFGLYSETGPGGGISHDGTRFHSKSQQIKKFKKKIEENDQ